MFWLVAFLFVHLFAGREVFREILRQPLAAFFQVPGIVDDEHNGYKRKDAEPAAPRHSIVDEATDEGYRDDKPQQCVCRNPDAPACTTIP